MRDLMQAPAIISLCALAFSALFSGCKGEPRRASGELRELPSTHREATIKGNAGWSKWCGPLAQAQAMAEPSAQHPTGALPCPNLLAKDALKARYPASQWPKLSKVGESVEVFYEEALSIETSTTTDPRCCYSVKHALAPSP